MAAYLGAISNLCVEYVEKGTGKLIAKATRFAIGCSWRIQMFRDGTSRTVATISGDLPEVTQRKLIFAILKELT